MKTYNLELAGLRVQLRTPDEIIISENLRPFLCEPHSETDCTIALQSCAVLPDIPENGVWHGAQCYDHDAGGWRVFHCDTTEKAAFAVTELLTNGNIEISVLPEHLSWFAGSEGIFNRIGLETLLLQHRGLMLHASLITYRNQAIAFTGPSGVGKSTQAELWRTHLGAEVVNGDRAALRKTQNAWLAYGSPYAGTSGIYKNDHAALAAVVVLRQAKENRLRSLLPTEALRYLYPELSVHRWEKFFVEKAADLCLQLIMDTPVYLLECRPEESAVELLKKGLSL